MSVSVNVSERDDLQVPFQLVKFVCMVDELEDNACIYLRLYLNDQSVVGIYVRLFHRLSNTVGHRTDSRLENQKNKTAASDVRDRVKYFA